MKITDFVFETKSSCLAVPCVDPSPTFDSFILGVLGKHMVEAFSCKKNQIILSFQPTLTSVIDATVSVEMIKTMLTSYLQEINLVLMVITVREWDVTSLMISLSSSSASGYKWFEKRIPCLGINLANLNIKNTYLVASSLKFRSVNAVCTIYHRIHTILRIKCNVD